MAAVTPFGIITNCFTAVIGHGIIVFIFSIRFINLQTAYNATATVCQYYYHTLLAYDVTGSHCRLSLYYHTSFTHISCLYRYHRLHY